jgi:hypothetical protein
VPIMVQALSPTYASLAFLIHLCGKFGNGLRGLGLLERLKGLFERWPSERPSLSPWR